MSFKRSTRLSRRSPKSGEGRFGLQCQIKGKWTDLPLGEKPFVAKTRASAMLKRIELGSRLASI